MRGTRTFTECCLGRRHLFIDVGITKCVLLVASHVIILSRVSNSSARSANKAFTAFSLFTTVIASFCAQRSKRLGTFVTPKMPIMFSWCGDVIHMAVDTPCQLCGVWIPWKPSLLFDEVYILSSLSLYWYFAINSTHIVSIHYSRDFGNIG